MASSSLTSFSLRLATVGAELGAVDVEVVEQALEVVLAVGADRRALDVREDPRERLVEVLVAGGALRATLANSSLGRM